MQLNKHPLFTGTIILTATGLASRVIGFFYRIFLSNLIGAGGLGIYQMVFPILTLALSLCTGGIQTAISKFTAERKDHAPFYAGLTLSLLLSLISSMLLCTQSDWLAIHILNESSCGILLRIVSLSLPFACVHACFNGYYYGKNQTTVPAVSQLFEQICRVLAVYIFYLVASEKELDITPAFAVWGVVCGEIAACLFCLTTFRFRRAHLSISAFRHLGTFALPLTGNRVILNLFASAEAILIPLSLTAYGCSRDEAVAIFGTLTGMAMPIVLLPSVFTGSLSVLLLPSIAEASACGNTKKIHSTIQRTVELCVVLGLCCTLNFLIFGHFTGERLFHSSLAGDFIVSLGWMCPFLFLTGTLSSILHGLDKPLYTFIFNVIGCGIRLFAILLLVPRYGLFIYLWSMLASQIVQAGAYLIILLI